MEGRATNDDVYPIVLPQTTDQKERMMRKVIASVFETLDGYMVGPNEDMSWVMDNFNDEMAEYAGDLMESMDTILLGRVTYEIMTNFWPANTQETAPGADKMNNTPKVVFSRTLDKAEWGKHNNARVVREHASEEIAKLKGLPGKNMVIYGSANLIQGFSQLGLIDEYQLLVHPLVMGAGKPLFANMTNPLNLKLLRTEVYKNGVVVLYYEPAR
jgi:dihydrofolate reductase